MTHRWSAVAAWSLATLAALAGTARAQPPDDLRIRYNSGQPVVPVYEGWERKADGSFDMIFGYMNRNYVEEVIIPVGPTNHVEPGGPDRGQPGYFYPRVNRFAFRVNVPKEWGATTLVWTLTVHGRTEKAYGSLAPMWEIDPIVEIQNSGGGGPDETVVSSQPPSITIEPVILPAPARAVSSARQAPVTFTKDIAPIFQRSCQSCHRPDTIAPMSLLTYEDARPWAASIREKVATREMPPWHVVRNVGIEKFKNDPSLSDEEIATIVSWVTAGAPRGDPADMPPPKDFADAGVWHIGKPDLVVTAPTHKVPAAGADWWGVYTVPSGLTEDRYIKAVEAKPANKGSSRVVHHILAFAEESNSAGRTREDDEIFGRGEFLVEYSVGKGGETFQDGSGRLLKAGSTIRFELHYHSIGEEVTDASQIAFVFHPKGYKPKRVQHTRAVGHGGNLDIPSGAQYVRSDGYTRLDSAGMLTGFQPHMHVRGKAQCLELIYPTGGVDERVEQIGCARFEFGSVTVYNWADDVTPVYPAGTIVHVINWHDNSATPKNPDPKNWVGSGNRTIDEMGFSWISYFNLTNAEYREILEARAAARQKNNVVTATHGASAGAGALSPAPARRRAARSTGRTTDLPLPINVPFPPPRRPPRGLSAGVIVHRGPAPVAFEPDGFTRVTNGELVVKAIFSHPGTYVLRAIASDGMLRASNDFTITVNQPAPTEGR